MQTAEGAYSEITEMIQRMRSLAVQSASGTLTNEDRDLIQEEVNQILSEIDRFEDTVDFNGKKILQGTSDISADDIANLTQYLTDYWISNGQDIANTVFDMGGAGGPLTVVFEAGTQGGVLAYVQTWEDGGGNITQQELHIELADFVPITYPNGGSGTYYNDRIITHEMVHASHAWHSDGIYNFNSESTWFKEGVAEYSHGANDRVLGDGGSTVAGSAAIRSLDLSAWGGTSLYYSSAYEAVMYMNRTYGGGAGDTDGSGGVTDEIFQRMAAGDSFDDAIDFIDDGIVNGSLDEASFLTAYNADGAYDATIQADAAAGAGGADTGGYWALEGGGGKSAENTVDDSLTPGLGAFTLSFDPYENTQLAMQVGANNGQTINIGLSQINTSSLGISSLSLESQNSAQAAIGLLDEALSTLNSSRANIGAMQNRLEKTFEFSGIQLENQMAAESRIRDTDFASEMINFTKNQIVTQASQSMLAQSNFQMQNILQLLRI